MDASSRGLASALLLLRHRVEDRTRCDELSCCSSVTEPANGLERALASSLKLLIRRGAVTAGECSGDEMSTSNRDHVAPEIALRLRLTMGAPLLLMPSLLLQ